MNALAAKLGLGHDLAFYDVYSLDDPDLLALVPRPALALLVIIPMTESWRRDRDREDAGMDEYAGSGEGAPVIWWKQTIGHACGSIGLLHCATNGPASQHILPGSELERIRSTAIPLATSDRAEALYNNQEFEAAHQAVAGMGDTAAPSIEGGRRGGRRGGAGGGGRGARRGGRGGAR